MKKIVGILAAGAALTASVFAADVSATLKAKVNLWSDKGYGAANWDGDAAFATLNASSDNGGANVDIRFKTFDDEKKLYVHNWNVWVKPVSQFELKVGTDNRAKNLWNAQYSWWTPYGVETEAADGGLIATLKPIEGLNINAKIDTPKTATKDFADNVAVTVGGSYAIDGLGNVAFDYLYLPMSKDIPLLGTVKVKNNAIGLGFELTSVENLNAKLIASALLYDSDLDIDPTIKVECEAKYTMDALSLYLSDRMILRTDDLTDEKLVNSTYVKVGYKVNETIAIDAFGGFGLNTAQDGSSPWNGKISAFEFTKSSDITAGVDVTLSYGSAKLIPGFRLDSAKVGDADATTTWSIPLVFQYNY